MTTLKTRRTPATYTGRAIGRCRLCSATYAYPYATTNDIPYRMACPCCGKAFIVLEGIYGRESAGRCDSRCTGATGHNCECSCGGSNHGADHLR